MTRIKATKRRAGLRRLIINLMVRLLVKERASYRQRYPNDIDKLRETLRPGDVILVEGSQRVSEVIKYLTQSSWSHAALYVGDAIVQRGGQLAATMTAAHGNEAEALLVEANIETGVTGVPLSKYRRHNIRICRPINLRPGDLNTVLDTVISEIGRSYSVRHIVELLRYFFPVSLIPKRFRQTALEHSGQLSEQVICSSQIATAFQKVRYPIQPLITELDGVPRKLSARGRFRLLFGRNNGSDVHVRGLFTACNPHFVTPRDFDLSPYFEVVKVDVGELKTFDYKTITWTAPATAGAVVEQRPREVVREPALALQAGTKTG